MTQNIVKDGYNQVAQIYSSQRDQFSSVQYLDILAGKLQPASKILDIGCGSGVPVSKYFYDKGFEVSGIDISEKQIQLAKQNLPNCNFQVADMQDLSSAQFTVDAVVSFYAIFHTPREKHLDIFKNIYSYLPTGGYLLVTMGSSEWEGAEDFHGAKMWWSHYSSQKNEEIIQKAGFEIIFSKIDTSGGEKHQVVLACKN